MNIPGLGTSYSVTFEPSEMTSISKDELTALRAELASYRALPLIPKPDHDRVVQQRDEYAQRLDDLTRTPPDEALAARYARLLDLVAAELRHGDKEWHTPERRAVRDEMRAELMEAGR